MDVDAGRNLRTKPRRRAINSIVKARHGVPVNRAARDAHAQGQARRDQHKKLRRAWDVGSRNAADSATLAARASETTRVVTGAGVLRPEHVAAVTDALMYEHRLNTIVTCSCCDCRISVLHMDKRLFRRNEPPASTLLRGIVVPTSPPIDLGPLILASSHFLLAARSRRQRLAGDVVADGLPDLHRPGAVKSHLDLTKLAGLAS